MKLTDRAPRRFSWALTALLVLSGFEAAAALERTEHRVPTADGIKIFVVRVGPSGPSRGAVVLTHGAGSPSSAVWDLPHGHSVQAALAGAGFDTFAVDVRGFGGSTWPSALSGSRRGPPAVRAQEVLPDVDAAVRFAITATGHRRVDLIGWSWGCVVAGLYASTRPEAIRRLALFAPVFDRRWPSRHRTREAWREEPRSLHLKWLDPARERPEVRAAYVERLFRFARGDTLRLPNGPYRDVYGPDAPVWQPEHIIAPTLIVRGSEDRAALRKAALRLQGRLERAPWIRYVELPDAGHFAFRTKASPRLQTTLRDFLVD